MTLYFVPWDTTVTLSNRLFGEDPVANRFFESDEIKPETCLSFRLEKKRSRFCHGAVGPGRECLLRPLSKNKVFRTPGQREGRAATNSTA